MVITKQTDRKDRCTVFRLKNYNDYTFLRMKIVTSHAKMYTMAIHLHNQPPFACPLPSLCHQFVVNQMPFKWIGSTVQKNFQESLVTRFQLENHVVVMGNWLCFQWQLVRLLHLQRTWLALDINEPIHQSKRVGGRSSKHGGLSLSLVSSNISCMGWVGEIKYGLIAAARGTFTS